MNARRQKDRLNGSTFADLISRKQITGPKNSGRMEKRLPIIVMVHLVHEMAADAEGAERAYTDNVSPIGARVFSKHPWHPGDLIWITPVNEQAVLGKVVYCQCLADNRYRFGVKFAGGPVTWSALERYACP